MTMVAVAVGVGVTLDTTIKCGVKCHNKQHSETVVVAYLASRPNVYCTPAVLLAVSAP